MKTPDPCRTSEECVVCSGKEASQIAAYRCIFSSRTAEDAYRPREQWSRFDKLGLGSFLVEEYIPRFATALGVNSRPSG